MEQDLITQLYDISIFFKKCRIPYLVKLLDFLSFFGIKIRSSVNAKENQVVALAFFLQNIKGISKTMTYTELLEHIKASQHNSSELAQFTHFFEIIYSFTCRDKEAFKTTFISNQLSIEIDKEKKDFGPNQLSYKIEELFTTQDPSNGFVNLNLLINELSTAQATLKSFFIYFHTHIYSALLSNVDSITSVISKANFSQRVLTCRDYCLSKCDALNPLKLALPYYQYYVDLYQLNDKLSNAKKLISTGLPSLKAFPQIEWRNTIIKPLDNVKVFFMDKAVKFKTDLSSLSLPGRERVIELSKGVIEKMKSQYGEITAYTIVKNKEMTVVIQKKFAFVFEELMRNYLKMIELINYKDAITKSKEIICGYYQRWLKSENDQPDFEDKMATERSINLELSKVNVTDKALPQ